MNCIIIEDQPPAQRILKRFAEDIGTLQLKATFSDAIQALDFLKSNDIDLIFLDIHLPKLSGIDFLKTLPNPPHVILTTAFADYALESYEFNVVDYLLKPFSFERFVKAITKIPLKSNSSLKENENLNNISYPADIFIKSGYEHIRITVEEIFYIQSDTDYTEIYISKKKYLTSEALHYWMDNLNPMQFVRVHKSFIVNVSKIEKVVANKVHLSDGNKIPIGRTFKEQFLKKLIK